MSSSPRAEAGRSRIRSPRTWSLRARLLASQIVLLALVCAAIGVGTELALQRFLMNQLDDRLAETGRRSAACSTFAATATADPPELVPRPPGYPRRVIIHDDFGPGPAVPQRPRAGRPHRRRGDIARHAGRCGRHHRRRHPVRNQHHRSATTRRRPAEPQAGHRGTRRAGPLPRRRDARAGPRRDDRDRACRPRTSTTPC